MNSTLKRIEACGLVPVVVFNDAANAVKTAEALLAGGVDVMEITLRTDAGIDAIELVAKECPDILVGAGTVLTMAQCKEAIKRGAKFIVSAGFDPDIVQYCLDQNVLPCPGCVTPTEITAALKLGLNVLKFFPANIYGGKAAMKALNGPFRSVRFIPTGGVNLDNLADFGIVIAAVGGGWLCPTKAIDEGRFGDITDVCAKSVAVYRG